MVSSRWNKAKYWHRCIGQQPDLTFDQGRQSLSTAYVLTPLDSPKRRSWYQKWQVIKNYMARLGTVGCVYHMPPFMPCTTCCVCEHREECRRRSVASPTSRPSLKCFENRLGITHTLDLETIYYGTSQIVRNFPNSSKLRGITTNHPILTAITRYQNPRLKKNQCSVSLCCQKKLHSTVQPRLSASSFNSLMDLSWEELPIGHCGVTLVAPSGNWVFFGMIASSLTQNLQNMHHVNLCPLCIGPLPALKTTKAAARKDVAAEMQRHVLPLSRDTKTWLANVPKICKPSPRVEG